MLYMMTGISFGNTRFFVQVGNALMELFIFIQMIFSCENQIFNLTGFFVELLNILFRGFPCGNLCNPGLHAHANFKEFANKLDIILHVGKTKGVVDHAGVVRDECARAATNFQNIACHKQLDCLAHRAATDIQLLCKFELIWQFISDFQMLVNDYVANFFCNEKPVADYRYFLGFECFPESLETYVFFLFSENRL